jgi:hypothetical protein
MLAAWQDRSPKQPRRGEGNHAGQAHWLGGHEDKRVPRHVAFLQAVLRLTTSQQGSDFAAFQLPEGGTFEVVGPRDQDHAHFSTGPVVGSWSTTSPPPSGSWRQPGGAPRGQVDERGGGWRHFRAPDGNVYELTSG